MVLKVLDYRKSETHNGVYEEWNYFDNIESASCYFDEGSNFTVVRCRLVSGDFVTVAIPNVAYLMSDSGKTIEKIIGETIEEHGDTDEAVYETLQEAVAAATKE